MGAISGSQAVVNALLNEGVEYIFGIPGGAVLPLYDALYDAPFRHVLARHEQAAALAADGYARVTGKVGVCIATSGPGATNLITGLATSYIDSVPVVAITGNVPRDLIGTDAFQEADTYGLSMPVTKHNYIVWNPADLVDILHEAFAVVRHGRPGPVLIDIPKDIFTSPIHQSSSGYRRWQPAAWCSTEISEEALLTAARFIANAKRPVLYAGGGVISSDASEKLRQVAELAGIPTTTTLMALGAFPADSPLFLGMPGMHGTYAANMALTETDCLIAVGTRFDDRVTGKVSDFAPDATIIHIDVDASEHGKVKAARVPITADARQGLELLAAALRKLEIQDHSAWLEKIAAWKREHPYRYERSDNELLPQQVIEELDHLTGGNAVVTTGVGQHQMWTAMFYTFRRPRQLLTSGGLGTMGYGLPAAIGAQIGLPHELVICIDGDGSFQMNVQELAVVKELNLPIKIFILNNRCHGMVRQWQQLFYNERLAASLFQYQPDFVKLAEAYGINAIRVEHPDELTRSIKEALDSRGPFLVECVVKQDENVLPMVPPGAALRAMIQA